MTGSFHVTLCKMALIKSWSRSAPFYLCDINFDACQTVNWLPAEFRLSLGVGVGGSDTFAASFASLGVVSSVHGCTCDYSLVCHVFVDQWSIFTLRYITVNTA